MVEMMHFWSNTRHSTWTLAGQIVNTVYVTIEWHLRIEPKLLKFYSRKFKDPIIFINVSLK